MGGQLQQVHGPSQADVLPSLRGTQTPENLCHISNQPEETASMHGRGINAVVRHLQIQLDQVCRLRAADIGASWTPDPLASQNCMRLHMQCLESKHVCRLNPPNTPTSLDTWTCRWEGRGRYGAAEGREEGI